MFARALCLILAAAVLSLGPVCKPARAGDDMEKVWIGTGILVGTGAVMAGVVIALRNSGRFSASAKPIDRQLAGAFVAAGEHKAPRLDTTAEEARPRQFLSPEIGYNASTQSVTFGAVGTF